MSTTAAIDERGMLRHVDDAKRRSALSLVREGRLYELARVFDEHAPVFPGRSFHQTLVTTAHHANEMAPVGDNDVNWITEVFSSTTQLGTHLDTLGHLQEGGRGFGGLTVAQLAGPAGLAHLGAETVPQIVTRGHLVDVAPLGAGDVIPLGAVAGLDLEPGDAVLFHTGWGTHWPDSERYLSGEPGPGLAVARHLAESGVALTGCDTWSYGPVPAENPRRPFEVPQLLNVHHGVFVVENLDLSSLAEDGVTEFALVLTFPRLRGATGAWTTPIALV
ncbi:MAG: cyclase family protein [Gaiella sp.]